MNAERFTALTSEIVTEGTAEALWKKLSPYFGKVDALADQARYVHEQWVVGELTRRNGMNLLEKVLNDLER